MKTLNLTASLRKSTNTVTGSIRYYVFMYDSFYKRISKGDFLDFENQATRADCFLTKLDGNIVRQDKNIYWTHQAKG